MGFFRFLVVFCICIHLIPQPAVAQDGIEFRVATIERKPFAFKNADGWTGFSIELWREIADIIDVQYDFRETYNFADLLGSLTNGSVDAAVANISVTFEREQRMDFSQPIFDSGLMVLASVDGQPSVIGTLLSRDLLLWLLGAFGILLIAANLIYFSERKHNPAFQHSYLKGLGEGVWWAFNAILNAGFEIVSPNTRAGRALAFTMILLGLFVVSAFVAQVTATLTVGKLNAQVAGYEDLYDKKVGTTSASTSANFLTARSIKHSGYESVEDVIEALEDGKIDAVVHDAPIVAYYAATVGKGRFTTVGRLFHPEKYGIALPSGSTRTEQINLALLQLRENGTYANLVDKWFGDGYQN